VTFSLIALNTLVYVVSLVLAVKTDGDSQVWIYHHLWLNPATSGWTAYVTSMFVHAGFWHLFGNMVFLFLFGGCAEDLVGRGRFLAFYFLGGFVAELVYIASIPGHFASTIPMGGASGAITSCMGMCLLLRPDAEITFKYFYFFIRAGYGEWEIPTWMVVSFWFLKDLFWLVIGLEFSSRRGGGTAFGAHVGGFLAGMALIALFRLGARKTKTEARPETILSLKEIQAAGASSATAAAPVHRPQPADYEIPTIYLHADGIQSGPFTLADIQSRLARQELGAATLYWAEGMSQWESIQDLADHPLT